MQSADFVATLFDGRANPAKVVTLSGDLTVEDRALLIVMVDKCPVHKLLEGEAEIIKREAA